MYQRAILLMMIIGGIQAMTVRSNTSTERPTWNTSEQPLTILDVFGNTQYEAYCVNNTNATGEDDAMKYITESDPHWSTTMETGPPGSLKSLNCLSAYDKHLVISLLCTIHQMRDNF